MHARTRRSALLAFLTAGLFALALAPSNEAVAKATHFWKPVENVKVAIFRVETGDEPGDADWDIYLRPVSPDDSAAFWRYFWRPSNQKWIDESFAPAIQAMKGKWSGECRSCAGTGPLGTGCDARVGEQYDVNPCPNLMACTACYLDAERHGVVDELADFAVKAELFFGEDLPSVSTIEICSARSAANGKTYGCNQDLDARQAKAMFDLGLETRAGKRMRGEGTVCNELDWKDGKYVAVAGKSACGKTAYFSGWSTHDEIHANRNEIHPVTAIAIDDGMVGNHTRRVRAGTFIDGSMDDYGVGFMVKDIFGSKATYDYHYMKRSGLPASVTIPFSGPDLPPPRPGANCVPWSDNTRCSLWLPECSLDDLFSFHVLDTTRHAVADRCGDRTVDMDWTQPNGAGWVATANLGWQHADYSFKLNAALAEPKGGILSDHVPTTTAASNACKMPSGSFDAKQLRRWYRFKVHSDAEFGHAKDVRWTWTPPLADSTVPSPGAVPQVKGGSDLHIWVPVPDKSPSHYFYPDFDAWYAGTVEAHVTVGGAPIVWSGDEIKAPRPTVKIEPVNPTVDASGRFSVTLDADAAGFCGDAETWKYTWDLSMYQAPKTGPLVAVGKPSFESKKKGPQREITLPFTPGQRAIVKVHVQDALGVEGEDAEIALTAPLLQIAATSSCKDGDGGASLSRPSRPMAWPETTTVTSFTQKLCRQTQVQASVWAVPAGVDKVFPESSVGAVTYTWSDLKIAIAPSQPPYQWTWQPVPATWKVLHPDNPDRTIVIVPDAAVWFTYQATVTATDKFGRQALANVSGSNDFTQLSDLVDRVTKQYAHWRPGSPAPDAAKSYTDPLTNELAILLRNAKLVDPASATHVASIRESLLEFSEWATARAGRERKLPYARAPKPVFTARPTSAEMAIKALVSAARANATRAP